MYEGRPRRWFKVLGSHVDVSELMSAELRQLYGRSVKLVEVRKATKWEEAQYLRGDEAKNKFCPTGRDRPSTSTSGDP